MGLPEWCQTHTFLEFLQLTEEHKMNEEVNPEVTQPITNPVEVAIPADEIVVVLPSTFGDEPSEAKDPA